MGNLAGCHSHSCPELSHCHTVMEFAFHASEFDLSLPRSQLHFKTWLRDRAWVSWALHTVVNLVPLFPAVRNSDFGFFCCSIFSKVSSADFRTQLCSLWQWFVHDITSSQPSRIIPVASRNIARVFFAKHSSSWLIFLGVFKVAVTCLFHPFPFSWKMWSI